MLSCHLERAPHALWHFCMPVTCMSKMCGVMPATSKTSSGIAVASDPAVFSYCAATLLLCDAHVSVHSMLIETDSERDLFIKVDQSDEISRLMQEFDSQGRLRSTNLSFEFCDRAPPASMQFSAPYHGLNCPVLGSGFCQVGCRGGDNSPKTLEDFTGPTRPGC